MNPLGDKRENIKYSKSETSQKFSGEETELFEGTKERK